MIFGDIVFNLGDSHITNPPTNSSLWVPILVMIVGNIVTIWLFYKRIKVDRQKEIGAIFRVREDLARFQRMARRTEELSFSLLSLQHLVKNFFDS